MWKAHEAFDHMVPMDTHRAQEVANRQADLRRHFE